MKLLPITSLLVQTRTTEREEAGHGMVTSCAPKKPHKQWYITYIQAWELVKKQFKLPYGWLFMAQQQHQVEIQIPKRILLMIIGNTSS
jgi:hypothetical protein